MFADPVQQALGSGWALKRVREPPFPLSPTSVRQTELFDGPETGMTMVIHTARVDAVATLEPSREAIPAHGRQCIGEESLPPR